MKKNLVSNMTKTFNKAKFKIGKHSPEILLVVGIAGVIGTVITACRETLKVDDILEDNRKTVEKIEIASNDEDVKKKGYSDEDKNTDLQNQGIKTGIAIAKTYAPSAALGAVSVGCILASHGIMKKRNVALLGAFTTVDTAFKKYRSNVVDRYGKDVDWELKNNVKPITVSETIVNPDTGEEITVETKRKETGINLDEGLSEYAFFFDETTSRAFEKSKDPLHISDYNFMFLNAQESYANNRLHARGYLYLNDVLDSLDIPQTKAGQVVGWVYRPDDPDWNGDNEVSFGIREVTAYDNLGEPYKKIALDFNVDGVILDMMDSK